MNPSLKNIRSPVNDHEARWRLNAKGKRLKAEVL